MLEEELKNKIARDYFADYDTTKILGKIDFCVAVPQSSNQLFETQSLLWAEAKQGSRHDIYESFVQLIFTIGRARTFDHYLPPVLLGAFDEEKMAFLPYATVMDVFYQNDFNWNVAPSNHYSKEFVQLHTMLHDKLVGEMTFFRYATDSKELRKFIAQNMRLGGGNVKKLRVDKNNFTHVYNKWLEAVKPTINIVWDEANKAGLIDADFFLADLLSEHNLTLKEKLFVLLRDKRYVFNRERKITGAISSEEADTMDNMAAHTQFWNIYQRPPRREYWDYIVERRDLLVPQDIRERKGSYFTPRRWVELSQQYLAMELGDDWQDEYVVWDCAAGTGNLLAGLTNKYSIYASTLDKQDVNAMQERISAGKLNLLESHVFQFDFLNDPFTKLPQSLLDIINDPEKRKKLVIYINPPYAEAANKQTVTGKGKNKTDVAVKNMTYCTYAKDIGIAGRELFAQFFIRIHHQIPNCVLAEFSKLKILQAPNFRDFRESFRAKLGRFFLVPAYTFDNVKGKFPIGFFVWHLGEDVPYDNVVGDVYNEHGEFIGQKTISCNDAQPTINDWIITTRKRIGETNIGYMSAKGADFQNQNYNFLINDKSQLPHPRGTWATTHNIKEIVVYYAVRHSIVATWLNDRDQFLFPNEKWSTDKLFQSDCLAYTLFHGQNNISIDQGTNHWIPFTEEEVEAKERFASHFMSDYISGKTKKKSGAATQTTLPGFGPSDQQTGSNDSEPITFSPAAQAVMDAGKALWRYYHAQPGARADAAFYDIRLHFQGLNDKGKMNSDSEDEQYNKLIGELRSRLKTLARQIEPKVYDYGFLKR